MLYMVIAFGNAQTPHENSHFSKMTSLCDNCIESNKQICDNLPGQWEGVQAAVFLANSPNLKFFVYNGKWNIPNTARIIGSKMNTIL